MRLPKIAVIRSGFAIRNRQVMALLIDGQVFPYPTFGGYAIGVDMENQPGVSLTLAADSVEVQDEIDQDRFEQLIAEMVERHQPQAWIVYHAYNEEQSISLVGLATTFGAAQELARADCEHDLEWDTESPIRGSARTGDNSAYHVARYPIQ
jgi:hypothetical protein